MKTVHLSEDHLFENGYISLSNLKLEGLPDSVVVNGFRMHKKTELHISLVAVKLLAQLILPTDTNRVQEEIVAEFNEFLTKQPLADFTLLNKYYFVIKDVRKSLVVMCEVPGLADFFKLLSDKYSMPLPQQPAHITLYSLQRDAGIGILSKAELAEIAQPVQISELAELRLATVAA